MKLLKMNKFLLLLSFLTIIIIACNSKEQSYKTDSTLVTQRDTIQEYSKEDIEKYKREVKQSYENLLSFKDDKEFHEKGFGKGGKYHEWFEKIQEQVKSPMSKIVIREGLVVGEIQSMGMEYMQSKGKETTAVKLFKKDLDKLFYPKPTEKQIQLNEDDAKDIEFGELFGEWKIVSSTINMSYNYKIYKKNGKFSGIKDDDYAAPEILIKKGYKYIVKGNRFGEYYEINESKAMTLFDMDGELKSAGYSAELLK